MPVEFDPFQYVPRTVFGMGTLLLNSDCKISSTLGENRS
ncbi:hypothetical protein LEP1GSC194_0901, partial [Leptospira alstonii serovar Sichuan str. 79601]